LGERGRTVQGVGGEQGAMWCKEREEGDWARMGLYEAGAGCADIVRATLAAQPSASTFTL
jgi:hypothetical protein